MKNLLIIGASGLVGKAIAKQCLIDFDVYGTYFSNATTLSGDKQFQLNIEEDYKIREILDVVQPNIIVSCLHGDFESQYKFHERLAEEIKSRDCLLYFFSTTNVFDGDLSKHHSELDEPISKSAYGQYKINCEKMLVQRLGPRARIVRIPGVWGIDSPRLNRVKNSMEDPPIQPYSNLECNFILDSQLALQMHYIFKSQLSGIIHLGATDMMMEGAFYKELLAKLSTEEVNLQYKPYQDENKTYYFGLISSREDLPRSLAITNGEIIASLV